MIFDAIKRRLFGQAKPPPTQPFNGAMPTNLKRRTTNALQTNWILPSVGAVTPNYLEMILRGAVAGNHIQQAQLFDLMLDSWPELATCVQELTYGVKRREIIFDPFTEEDEKPTDSAVEKTKLVSTVLRKMNPVVSQGEFGLKDTVENLMAAWFRGYTVMETIWDTYEAGSLGTVTGPRATVYVQPQQYGFNQFGIMGLNPNPYYFDTSLALPPPNQSQLVDFPPHKFLIGIHQVKPGAVLGGPMLRVLAWWWCACNFSADWLLNLAQVFGLPFRWATYPTGAAEATISAICDMLANMGSAGWGAFPQGTTLELKGENAGKGDSSPQAHLLDRADRYARSLILGQTMTGNTMTSGKGGQAFGTVEAQLKQDRLEAASDYVADVFNGQLIPSILRLNYGNDDEAPVCRFLEENEGSYQDAQRDQILVNIGTPIPLSHIRKKYSIPEPEGDEEVLVPPVAQVKPPTTLGPSQEDSLTQKAAEGQPVSQQQQDRQDKVTKAVQSRLSRIVLIPDDAEFHSELKKLSGELVTGKNGKHD
jgi:phage gp29-like protein